jgi:hypothetical protein
MIMYITLMHSYMERGAMRLVMPHTRARPFRALTLCCLRPQTLVSLHAPHLFLVRCRRRSSPGAFPDPSPPARDGKSTCEEFLLVIPCILGA